MYREVTCFINIPKKLSLFHFVFGLVMTLFMVFILPFIKHGAQAIRVCVVNTLFYIVYVIPFLSH